MGNNFMTARFPACFAFPIAFAVPMSRRAQISIFRSVFMSSKTMRLSSVQRCWSVAAQNIHDLSDYFKMTKVDA